jgi:hypothetical protein
MAIRTVNILGSGGAYMKNTKISFVTVILVFLILHLTSVALPDAVHADALQTGTIVVNTNKSEAAFTLVGPETYEGTGETWIKTGVPSGTYKIVYSDISNRFTPQPEEKFLSPGDSITFEGEYIYLDFSVPTQSWFISPNVTDINEAEGKAELEVENNTELWLGFRHKLVGDGVVETDAPEEALQAEMFGTNLRLVPPAGKATYHVTFDSLKSGDTFEVSASYGGEYAAQVANTFDNVIMPGLGILGLPTDLKTLLEIVMQYKDHPYTLEAIEQLKSEGKFQKLKASKPITSLFIRIAKDRGIELTIKKLLGIFSDIKDLIDFLVYHLLVSVPELQGQATTARFETKGSSIPDNVILSVEVVGEGSTAPHPGVHVYSKGEELNITASPADGWEFSGWGGSAAGYESESISITMDSNNSLLAYFEEKITLPEWYGPIVSVESISGQPQVMKPNTEYSIKTNFYHPEGRENIKWAFLILNHPRNPLIVAWVEALDEVVLADGYKDYIDIIEVSSNPIVDGHQGYELIWKFTLGHEWPEVKNAINFGTYSVDENDLASELVLDDTQASFVEDDGVPEPGYDIFTLPFTDSDIMIQQGWWYTAPIGPNPDDPYAHNGIDYIKGLINQPSTWQPFDIVSAADGVAMYSSGGGYGDFVLIRHNMTDAEDRNYFTLYSHLGSIEDNITYRSDRFATDYENWTPVVQGQKIGVAGATGVSDPTWIHLHFEVLRGGYAHNKVDPYGIYRTRQYYPDGKNYTGNGPGSL